MPAPLFPPRLQVGDEVRVISPALSLAIIPDDVRNQAEAVLRGLGLRVTYGRHAALRGSFDSAPVAARLTDLHEAFADSRVKGILTTIGGYNSNQLLDGIDYDLIAANPKVFCGYSDITALSWAIFSRTGLITYSGPHFSTFGMRRGVDYTVDRFRQCVMTGEPFQVPPSATWSDDPWYRDQENRIFEPHAGLECLQPGTAEGLLLGGNLCTLNLLQGTRYWPGIAGALLLLEDDDESRAPTFDRDLQSLLHQPEAAEIRGVLIGRFQRASQIDGTALRAIVAGKPELAGLPVAAQANFGHTTPQFTFPVGGTGRLVAAPDRVSLTIVAH